MQEIFAIVVLAAVVCAVAYRIAKSKKRPKTGGGAIDKGSDDTQENMS